MSTKPSTESPTNRHYTQRIKRDSGSAERYTQRKSRKNKAEMNLVRKGFALLDNDVQRVLDAPCGVGRATILLASMGFETTGLDLGEAAVEVARRELAASDQAGTIEIGNLEALNYADGYFDAILCFRVYHHFPTDEIRERIISELCRVAKNYVLISYFSPYSITSLKRSLRAKLKQKTSIQHATTLASLTDKFEARGFSLVRNIPQQRFIHTLHLAVFKRQDSDS
jgi:2-polyprenyl-3-methyl-5-hydroxy-6-metoxy-1,4-benzoquinol methylase